MKKDKKFDTESLGGRLKGYEADYETEIGSDKHIVVRIDGHKFSKYTKGMRKPFDEILSKAMEQTTIDLVEEFNAYTGYTQSDEITLIIPTLVTTEKHKGANKPLWKHGYSGRVQKMVSLIAGFTTMSFNKHFALLALKQWDEGDTVEFHTYCAKMDEKVGKAWFDARIYGVDSDEEAFNSVLWRVRDAEKNSRSMFAQSYLSHKQLQGLTGQEQVQLCKEKTGHDWEEVQDKYKYGILIKKEQYQKEVSISLSGKHDEMKEALKDIPDTVTRSRVVSFAEHLTFSDEAVKMVLSKYKS